MSTSPQFHQRDPSDLVKLMLQYGISPTSQRLEVASVMLSQYQHLCAEEVFKELVARGAKVSKATVYNTLNLFSEKGLVRQVNVENKQIFFDSNISEHHHFYNEDTEELIDIDHAEVAISALPNLPEGTKATGINVVVKIKNT